MVAYPVAQLLDELLERVVGRGQLLMGVVRLEVHNDDLAAHVAHGAEEMVHLALRQGLHQEIVGAHDQVGGLGVSHVLPVAVVGVLAAITGRSLGRLGNHEVVPFVLDPSHVYRLLPMGYVDTPDRPGLAHAPLYARLRQPVLMFIPG
jgi:hypothetical protein